MKKMLLFLLSTVALFAVDIEDIDPGDIYYINGGFLNDDRRVIVVRVSHSKGKVKVRADNGDTEWVYPSKLLTKNQNENENLAHPFQLLAGLAALGGQPQGNSEGGYYIRVHNRCGETMRLAINYMPFKSTVWETHYWWDIKPGDNHYLYSNGAKIATKKALLYYYAESKYGSKYIIEGYKKVWISGKKYWMKELVDKEGATDIILNCN